MHAEKSRYSSVFFLACARARVVFTFLSTESFESGGVLGKAAKRLKGSRRFQWGMTSGRREGGRGLLKKRIICRLSSCFSQKPSRMPRNSLEEESDLVLQIGPSFCSSVYVILFHLGLCVVFGVQLLCI